MYRPVCTNICTAVCTDTHVPPRVHRPRRRPPPPSQVYEDIPVETSGRDVPPAVATFDELALPPAMMDNIRRCKYSKPTPVQKHAIPIALAGRDVMACAQVGGGGGGGS